MDTIKSVFTLIISIIFFAYNTSAFAQDREKDSLVNSIINAENAAYINAIQTNVDQKIMALNNWANDEVWNHPELVRDVAEQLISYSTKHQNDSLLSWSYHYQALAYYYMHYWNLSIDIYKKAMSTSWAQNSPIAQSFLAFCNLNIGCNYEYLGNYDKAAYYYYKSIKLNEDLGLPFVASEAKLDVASLEIRLGNWDKAQMNINEALYELESFKDSVRISEAYRMLFIIEIAKGHLEKAEEYFKKALKIGLKGNDKERLVKIYLDYGNALFQQKQTKEAYRSYQTALHYSDSLSFPATYFQVLSNLGKVQLYVKDYINAEKNLLKSYHGLTKLKARSMVVEVEQQLAQLYAEENKPMLFQQFFNNALARKDSLATSEKMRSIAESEVIYRTAKKDRQIDSQSYQLKIKKNQILLISSIGIVLLISLILVLRLLKKVKFQNKELLERNIELSKQWQKLQGSFFENQASDKESELFKKIYEFIVDDEEFKNPKLSVDYLAKKMNTNTKYISTSIKGKTGFNFNTFINTFRIEKAKTILRSSDSNKWTLETIAELCGFNNHTSFYQSFKKSTGLTPSVYRDISP